MDIRQIRGWMYNRLMPGRKGYTDAFSNGVEEFVSFACLQADLCSGNIRCPFSKCRNLKYLDPDEVQVHLYRKGFKPDYWYWTCHGESDPTLCVVFDTCSSTSSTAQEGYNEHLNRFENMVYDAAGPEYRVLPDQQIDESPNKEDVQRFSNSLHAAQKPQWQRCNDHTELSEENTRPSSEQDVRRDVADMKKGRMNGLGLESTVVNRNYSGSSSSSSQLVRRQEFENLKTKVENTKRMVLQMMEMLQPPMPTTEQAESGSKESESEEDFCGS